MENESVKTKKPINNKAKIAILVDTINYLNNDSNNKKEGELLSVIKTLIETLMDEYGIQVSHESGAVLNLSIRLLQHIRDNKLDLIFDEETKEIFAKTGVCRGPNYAFLKLKKGKNSLRNDSLDFEIYKNETEIFCHTREHIEGSLTDCYLEGMCYDGRTRNNNVFHICFNEYYENPGLIKCHDYTHEVFLDKRITTHKLYLISERAYYHTGYGYEDHITLRKTTNLEPLSVNSACATDILLKEIHTHLGMGPLERIIVDIPGFIPTARVDNELSIVNFDNDCIKDVFPNTYTNAKNFANKEKKHIR